MTTDLTHTPSASLAPLTDLQAQARDYASQSRAASTKRAYSHDWADFSSWCVERDRAALPASPETVALYLTDRAQSHKVGTLARRLAAISQAHKTAGHETPTRAAVVRAVVAGIRRTKGSAPVQKLPVRTEDIRVMVGTLPDSLLGTRDRALLLLGFAGAFRRSELVALDVADVTVAREGLIVTIRRSKTDQEGQGRKLGIPYGGDPATCPVGAYQMWVEHAHLTQGAIFRPVTRHGRVLDTRLSDRAVALVVKRAAQAAGLDPAMYAGHSLRAGLATSAAAAGASERAIMAQTGHKSVMMARRYIRNGSLFRDNAAATVGL
jgi:site-specific recombinase XerD